MEFLLLQRKFFNIVGYSLMKNETMYWKIFSRFNLLLIFAIMNGILSYVYANMSYLRLATDALCPYFCGILAVTKFLTFELYREKFYKFSWNLENKWKKCNIVFYLFPFCKNLLLSRFHNIGKL